MRWLAGSRDFRGALHAFVTGKKKGCPNRSMAGDNDEAPIETAHLLTADLKRHAITVQAGSA